MAYKINSTNIINDTTAFTNVGILTAVSFSGKGTIPAGTVMLFTDAAAPTGFTKLTTHNNKALRVVSGTGGGSGGVTDFTTALGIASTVTTGVIGDTTLTTPQLPTHSHAGAIGSGSIAFTGSALFTIPAAVGLTGGSGAHNHTFSSSLVADLRVKYVDAIIASRDA